MLLVEASEIGEFCLFTKLIAHMQYVGMQYNTMQYVRIYCIIETTLNLTLEICKIHIVLGCYRKV